MSYIITGIVLYCAFVALVVKVCAFNERPARIGGSRQPRAAVVEAARRGLRQRDDQ